MINIYEKLGITSNVSISIISIALRLFCGFLRTRLTKLLRLPNVTAYILAGIIIGPFCLNLVPDSFVCFYLKDNQTDPCSWRLR